MLYLRYTRRYIYIRLAKLKGAAGAHIYLFFKNLKHRCSSVELNAASSHDSVVFQF
jgi:hypothetical protein